MSKHYESTLFIYFNIFSFVVLYLEQKNHGIYKLDAAKNDIQGHSPQLSDSNKLFMALPIEKKKQFVSLSEPKL